MAVGAGALIDVDHLPDMIWHNYLGRSPTSTFVFHAWEWLGALIVSGALIGFPWWMTALVGGYASHIVTDHLFNRPLPLSYSIIYRAFHGFKMSKLYPEGSLDTPVQSFMKELRVLTGRKPNKSSDSDHDHG